MPGGATQEVKAEYRQRQDLGHMPLSGSLGGVLWGSQARAGLVNSSQKSEIFISPYRGLISGAHKAYGHWKAGESVDHKIGCLLVTRGLLPRVCVKALVSI